MSELIRPLAELGMAELEEVGGKNASLGEMIQHLAASGVRVPGGFATTASAFRHFLVEAGLDGRIREALEGLDINDVQALSRAGSEVRGWIMEASFPADLETAIREAYAAMEAEQGAGVSVAVRSSATAEDLPDASFAGQQETYLNVSGIEAVLAAIRAVYASLYNDRAIAYRTHHGFEHSQVALSAGIQRMVRSDIGASGVMFTLDTESGFRDAVFITAAYGLGETVVQGQVNPDEFYVHKPLLARGRPAILRRELGSKAIRMVYADEGGDPPVRTEEVPAGLRRRYCLGDEDILELARYAVAIEDHYGKPMDIEWAKDGADGRLYIVQARPETVKSRAGAGLLTRFHLRERGEVLVTGRSIGGRIGAGPVRVIGRVSEMHRVQPGDVLVADMTDPDWEPVMKRSAAIVTNRGGRTCHAAIVARELGIPAVVGCGDATERLGDGTAVTVSCAEGDVGTVYAGSLDFQQEDIELDRLPEPPVKIMMNVGNPERAFDFQFLPNQGVGLARLEFIINRMVGVHPYAVLQPGRLSAEEVAEVREHCAGYDDPVEFYVARLAEGVATIAAAFWPKPVIVRLSDFKSNEYANLLGGRPFEPQEENPMIGLRGAARYVSETFRAGFELECRAMRRVREDIGLTNVELMIPFVRTPTEAETVVAEMARNGLRRGDNGLRIIMMCEIPTNALRAEDFLRHVDGFSIGSNDLTQLTLGMDRDSGLVAQGFDERDPAVLRLIELAIQACRAQGKYIGICGQGPSDHPDLAEWLVEKGISSVSLNPDTVVETWLRLAKGSG